MIALKCYKSLCNSPRKFGILMGLNRKGLAQVESEIHEVSYSTKFTYLEGNDASHKVQKVLNKGGDAKLERTGIFKLFRM